MSNTRQKILTNATECFFQHGYAVANVSMISRYTGISRVTIHKQFKSKEELFRAVVVEHFNNNRIHLNQYIQSTDDFWSDTEIFILERCGGLFEEIKSTLIRTDLLHAGQTYCSDIIQENEMTVLKGIETRLSKELTAEHICLNKIDISIKDFARLITSAPLGIALSSIEEDNQAFVKHLMKTFKASTRPS
ncbi:MAG: TetR/AcrR family transcriptional regulator [Colwellia sp.]